MTTVFKADEIVLLLGAGASVDAGIPHAFGMIDKLEHLMEERAEWRSFQDLYNYVKSAVLYSDGIKGRFAGKSFNIERLVSTLDDLRKGNEHPLYPFVGAWAPRLAEVAGGNLEKLEKFRDQIVRELRDHWVQPGYYDEAEYYKHLGTFQREYQHPLRVFTLNYDLCVEKVCSDVKLERGFGESKTWDWRVFDPGTDQTPDIFFYKMHGSVDWERDVNRNLTFRESISHIEPRNLEIIFGTTYKLQYVDPFLFFAYEFRRWTLSTARVIITVGYGFGDEHVNGILAQALANNPKRRLLVVGPWEDEASWKNLVMQALSKPKDGQVRHWNLSAKQFFPDRLSIARISEEFPEEAPPFDEIGSTDEDAKRERPIGEEDMA